MFNLLEHECWLQNAHCATYIKPEIYNVKRRVVIGNLQEWNEWSVLRARIEESGV